MASKTNKQEVLELIQRHPEGLDDDDISEMTGIRPRQQIQQLCNRLVVTRHIRRESVEKDGKRRKIHNFPVPPGNGEPVDANETEDPGWRRRLSALVAATGKREHDLLDEALSMLACKVLENARGRKSR